MAKYECSVCGYIYDEADGIPETGIAPGTTWMDLPMDWICPLCGAEKNEFSKQGEPTTSEVKKPITTIKPSTDMKEMSPLEISALCTNLARGCEKQYLPQQEKAFRQLADFFRSKAEPVEEPSGQKLLELVEKDLTLGYPYANAIASRKPDRGALRSLVWSERATRMLQSLLTRYKAEGEKMLENTGVYLCTICGFLYLGDAAPEICPVCKVPSWKFERVEGRVS